MRKPQWRPFFWLGGFLTCLLVLSFAVAAVLAEGALHPLLRRRASDTATLAYSTSQAINGTARQVKIRAKDGVVLNAWWLSPERPNRRAVIACHGVADSAFGALGYGLLFLKNGYSVLVPESRGHGESGGFVTYGVLESEDLVEWIHWIKQHPITEIFGFGESLGAAILLQSLSRGADLKAVIADSCYSSFEAVAEERVARVVPKPLAILLVNEGILYVRLRHGVNLADARPDHTISSANVPILLIHGLADHETSAEESKQLAELNTEMTKLWLVPHAAHTGAYAAGPREFERRVLEWFSRIRTTKHLMPDRM